MDFGRELHAEYLQRHFFCETRPAIEHVGPREIAALVWPIFQELQGQVAFLGDVKASEEFDPEADAALFAFCETGDFASWEGVSAGAWAVLIDRLKWSIVALMAEESAGTAFTIPLPRVAPAKIRRDAAFLFLLGSPGRTPSPEWRATGGKIPEFPPDWPLSRQ